MRPCCLTAVGCIRIEHLPMCGELTHGDILDYTMHCSSLKRPAQEQTNPILSLLCLRNQCYISLEGYAVVRDEPWIQTKGFSIDQCEQWMFNWDRLQKYRKLKSTDRRQYIISRTSQACGSLHWALSLQKHSESFQIHMVIQEAEGKVIALAFDNHNTVLIHERLNMYNSCHVPANIPLLLWTNLLMMRWSAQPIQAL